MVIRDKLQVSQNVEQYHAMAYYRLSKDMGAGHESDSISNQRKLILEYIKRHPEISLEDEAYDDGYTGTNYDRPGFRSVLTAIEAGQINCVIVKDLSRLGREYIETGKYLEMIFPSLGVRFIAINDDVDSENSSSGDDLIIPIKNIMNESYCRELSKKLRNQFRIQRSNGEFLGAFACYGYCKSTDDKHKLVIDEYAAEIVRTIFLLKIEGYSQNAIADFLNSQHILAPAEYKKSQGLRYQSGFQSASSSKWTAVTLNRILKNPVYIGTLVQGKRGTPNYKIKTVRDRDKKDWITVPNNHPPIIDPLMFSVVQRMMERDTRISPKNQVVLPLAGVLFCADCGSSMLRRSVTRGNRKFYYYVCSGNKKGKGCSSHSFEQHKLENIVLHAITGQIAMIEELGKLIEQLGLSDINAIRARWLDRQIAQRDQEIDEYQAFRMKLYEALNDNLIDREEYQKMRAKYTAMIEKTETVVMNLTDRRADLLSGNESGSSFIEQYVKFHGITELTREVVISLIDKVYVYEDKHIKVEFNYRNEISQFQEILKKREVV